VSDPIFQSLIDRIQEVQNSHKDSTNDNAMLSLDWEFIFRDFDGWTVLYCSTRGNTDGYWINPRLCPKDAIDFSKEDLPTVSAAAYGDVMNGDKHWLEPCWGKFEDFDTSEIPLFFNRFYSGRRKGEESYIEFNQLVTHLLELHWSKIKKTYCRLDAQGNEIEKIKRINHDNLKLILIRRKTLDRLLHLGDWVLARYFEFTRSKGEFSPFNPMTTKKCKSSKYNAEYNLMIRDDYVQFRGTEIVRAKTPKEKLLSWKISDDEEEEIKYEKFAFYDAKNESFRENYSLDPKGFDNGTTKNDLPIDFSPIFFNAEVLDKYNYDPDKYEITERSISCRGGWYLDKFHKNDYNQIHVYAMHLARLPYKEQRHWALHNEKPKGGISKRAYQTDIEGKWPDEGEPLEKLKDALEKLGRLKEGEDGLTIWSPKGGSWESASKGLNYVTTENSNAWDNFNIALTNTTIEGFQSNTLKTIASSYGNNNKQLGSLGFIKVILESTNNQDQIPLTHEVLKGLQYWRTHGKAHGYHETPEGSLIEDANKRLQDVILAIETLTEIFGALDIPSIEK